MSFQWKKFDAIAPPRVPGVFAHQAPADTAATAEISQRDEESSGYEAGFAEGHAQGLAAAGAEQKKLLESLNHLLQEAQRRKADALNQAMSASAEILAALFAGLFNYELKQSPELLQQLCQQALKGIEYNHQVDIAVCRKDYDQLQNHLSHDAGLGDYQLSPDDTLNPGAVRLSVDDTLVDLDIVANVTAQLNQALTHLSSEHAHDGNA